MYFTFTQHLKDVVLPICKTGLNTRLVIIVTFLHIILLQSFRVNAQNCTANAGGNVTVCGSATTLTGSVSGTVGAGNPTWTFVSGPVTPVIVSPNTLVTNVTGMNLYGNYVFQLSQACGTGTATSQVTIAARPRPADFTAGPDKTGICATVGTVTLDGVIPANYTGTWSAVNIYSYESTGSVVNTNSSFSNTGTATPVFSLVNKTNHGIDPAYYAILTIVSADGVCTYRDTTVVRFCPNPALQVINRTRCIDNSSIQFFDLDASSPAFSTNTPGSSGAAANGTTVTINVTSQPAGANIAFNRLETRRIYVTGATIPGNYTFTITVSNCCGTVTSASMTFTISGISPNLVNFQPAGHTAPEQLALYASGGSGGEVHCGIANTSTPELFYFSLDPADPVSTVTTVSRTGILPSGASEPVITVSGAGTANRSASVNPGASGWRIGTYRFTVATGNGTCARTQLYYIHISDNNRAPLFVPDMTVCYPGTGTVSANITLPTVYQGVVNTSYFQDLGAYYNFQVISTPAGAATPQFPASNLRRINLTNVTMSNLDKPGDYVIRIIPFSGNGAGPFLEQEYACSGIPGPLQYDFTVHLETIINANAGSDQSLACVTSASLLGNATGAGTGIWTVASTPAGATPAFSNAVNPSTGVSGLSAAGNYTFAWNITTPVGGCVSSDTVLVSTTCALPVKLKNFAVNKSGNEVLLSWITSTEQNNKGFAVERSSNGTNWYDIGFINTQATNGNSNQELHYTFNDHAPANAQNWYRLRQTDFDGKYDYSEVRGLKMDNARVITLYPNPAKQDLVIKGLSGNETIIIYNALGGVQHRVKAQGPQVVLSLKNMSEGVYLVHIISENKVAEVHKFVKAN